MKSIHWSKVKPAHDVKLVGNSYIVYTTGYGDEQLADWSSFDAKEAQEYLDNLVLATKENDILRWCRKQSNGVPVMRNGTGPLEGKKVIADATQFFVSRSLALYVGKDWNDVHDQMEADGCFS